MIGFSISEEKKKVIRKIVKQAKMGFEKDGNTWTLGNSLVRIIKEWAAPNNLLKSDKTNLSNIEFYSRPEELAKIRNMVYRLYYKKETNYITPLAQICINIDKSFELRKEYPENVEDIIGFLKEKLPIEDQ